MAFRFLHTADFQIGKGFGQFPPDVAAILRAERLETLKRIASLAADLAVDAVLDRSGAGLHREAFERLLDALQHLRLPWGHGSSKIIR